MKHLLAVKTKEVSADVVPRKSIVVIAVEVHKPKGYGGIRMQGVPDVSAKRLFLFVNNSVAPDLLSLQIVGEGITDLNNMATYMRE